MANVKAKKKKKKPATTPKMCDPGVCDNCQYLCEGDFLCDKYEELVVSDWQPTKHYLMCGGDPKMREILFRGKRIDNGEWVEGYFYEDIGSLIKERASSVSTNTHLVDPSTVGQFTGLFDKRGSRIFEGDIVRWTWEKHPIIGHQSCYYDSHYFGALLVVRWLPAGYMLCPTNDKDLDRPSAGGKVDNYSFWNYQGGLEIAGNIHDNPELLEGGAADA